MPLSTYALRGSLKNNLPPKSPIHAIFQITSLFSRDFKPRKRSKKTIMSKFLWSVSFDWVPGLGRREPVNPGGPVERTTVALGRSRGAALAAKLSALGRERASERSDGEPAEPRPYTRTPPASWHNGTRTDLPRGYPFTGRQPYENGPAIDSGWRRPLTSFGLSVLIKVKMPLLFVIWVIFGITFLRITLALLRLICNLVLRFEIKFRQI